MKGWSKRNPRSKKMGGLTTKEYIDMCKDIEEEDRKAAEDKEGQQHEKDRQSAFDEVSCSNIACEFWNQKFDQNCGAEINGESAVVSCDKYTPDKELSKYDDAGDPDIY